MKLDFIGCYQTSLLFEVVRNLGVTNHYLLRMTEQSKEAYMEYQFTVPLYFGFWSIPLTLIFTIYPCMLKITLDLNYHWTPKKKKINGSFVTLFVIFLLNLK